MPAAARLLSAKALLESFGPHSKIAARIVGELGGVKVEAARGYYALVVDAIARAVTGATNCSEHVASLPISDEKRDQLDGIVGSFSLAPPVGDPLKALYHRLIPREARHAGGEYYTPDWLAEHLLDVANYPVAEGPRLLDPACGSGTFLIAGIRRLRKRCESEGLPPNETLERLVSSIVGIDLDPVAVIGARANYLLAISDLLPDCDRADISVPVHEGDSILDSFNDLGRFDCIVGNPPWVGWESLTEDYRQQTRPLWQHYGLFAQSGMSAILGAGKKDLAMLMSYAVTDQFLRDGGQLGFVITQSAFKTLGAGRGFRSFRWGTGDRATHVRVERVDDLTDFQPFEFAGTRTACFVWRKGTQTEYPLPYYLWQKTSKGKSIQNEATLSEARSSTRRLELAATPMEPSDPASIWLTCPAAVVESLHVIRGESEYIAHEGANTGGANAIYWLKESSDGRHKDAPTQSGPPRYENIVDGAKKPVDRVECEIESELLYPLLRGREVKRWTAAPSALLLMVQDPVSRRGIDECRFRADFPRAYAYLKSFESQLRERAAFRRYFMRKNKGGQRESGPFYSMFNIGPTTFAPWKVVWHRMVAPIGAAVVGRLNDKPILPQETHAFVACGCEEEAHFLAAMMNSTPFNYAAMSFSQSGGKSFGSPRLLRQLRLPEFAADDERHRIVVDISRRCHQVVDWPDVKRCHATLLTELDEVAAEIWRIDGRSAQRIRDAYSQLMKADLGK